MTNFIDKILTDNEKLLVTRPVEAKIITFSNSGRGGKRNWFAMTSEQLASCLNDMLIALDEFPPRYEEKVWRELFSLYLSDDVARTMGAVQTLPLFEVLSKIIHFANSDAPRPYKTINLDPVAVRNAIDALKAL